MCDSDVPANRANPLIGLLHLVPRSIVRERLIPINNGIVSTEEGLPVKMDIYPRRCRSCWTAYRTGFAVGCPTDRISAPYVQIGGPVWVSYHTLGNIGVIFIVLQISIPPERDPLTGHGQINPRHVPHRHLIG